MPPLSNRVKQLLIVFPLWQVGCLSRMENISIASAERTAFSLQRRHDCSCLTYSEANKQVLHSKMVLNKMHNEMQLLC